MAGGIKGGWGYGATNLSLEDCKKRCTLDPRCNAFVRRASDNGCFWKAEASAKTLDLNYKDPGHVCYLSQCGKGATYTPPKTTTPKTTTTTPTPVVESVAVCTKPVDVVFLLDRSGSIKDGPFVTMKDFTAKVCHCTSRHTLFCVFEPVLPLCAACMCWGWRRTFVHYAASGTCVIRRTALALKKRIKTHEH